MVIWLVFVVVFRSTGDDAGEKILIYEYAEHGSLDKYLRVAKTTRSLTWEKRISICLDTARGLDYLHSHIATNHRVIHRDIKSANILIGHDWKAMIADLGLSKIGRANESDSYLITNASGTHGYCDPAYMHTGILTKESDVYSFGVVMFEVLCGRLGFLNVNNEHRFLAPLAQRYYETGRLNEIIDPYLKIEVDSDSLKRFSEIAYPCLLNERDRRPSMALVVQKLEELMASSKILQINLKLVAQRSSIDSSSSKPLHGPKKGNSLSLYGNSDKAYCVLGHRTSNIRDIYTFGRKLQEIKFGTIYLCTEIATGIDYACKIISKKKLISNKHLEEVRKEIQIMHHLAGHNNIVSIKGAYEDLLHVHIVMELCNGGTLFDRIVQIGHYTEKKAAELIKIIVGVIEYYRSLAGALQYLTFTRPDISYAVQQICMHMHAPHNDHFLALKRILRYLKGTLHMGLQMTRSPVSSLVGFTDADWAGCPATRRSTSGYCVFLGDNLLSWSSKRQTVVSRSSAEAEYRGVANVVSEICWLRNLLLELGHPLQKASLVYTDNVSAVYMSGNPVHHQRTKHIEIDIHFVREKVQRGQIRVLHIPSRHNFSDIFTKGLPKLLFLDFRYSLSLRDPPLSTAGVY